MKKWKKVTLWIAGIVIVLVAGGLFAANYAIDKVLDSMVGMSVDDLIKEEGNDQGNTDGNASEPTPSNDTPSDDGTSSNEEQNQTNEPSANNGGGSNGEGVVDQESQASPKPSDSSSKGDSAAISTDKAKEVEEDITLADKAKVASVLLSKLSASDISTLKDLAGGGLSVDEKKQARDIILEKLSESEYDELIAIAAKHGLSQGKKYSEVVNE